MSDELRYGLDRRDFMMATIASVGASAVLAANTGAANAQGTTAPGAAGSAQVAPQGTVYTGDVIQGKKVISALDVNDLEPGRHFFYFQGVQMPTGQHWYVSVMVAKGAKPGKRVALIGGVHGDEISPVHTIQTVMSQLDPAEMSGTVMAVLTYPVRPSKAWRVDGPIQEGELTSSTSIASGLAMRMAPVRPAGMPGSYSTGSSGRTPTTR